MQTSNSQQDQCTIYYRRTRVPEAAFEELGDRGLLTPPFVDSFMSKTPEYARAYEVWQKVHKMMMRYEANVLHARYKYPAAREELGEAYRRLFDLTDDEIKDVFLFYDAYIEFVERQYDQCTGTLQNFFILLRRGFRSIFLPCPPHHVCGLSG